MADKEERKQKKKKKKKTRANILKGALPAANCFD
jgi:hypothetical protein